MQVLVEKTCFFRITVLEAWLQMFFSTDSELSYVYKDPKSKKVHGTFGLGWKCQRHTVSVYSLFRLWLLKTSFRTKYFYNFLFSNLIYQKRLELGIISIYTKALIVDKKKFLERQNFNFASQKYATLKQG